jgi:hypothetical protein
MEQSIMKLSIRKPRNLSMSKDLFVPKIQVVVEEFPIVKTNLEKIVNIQNIIFDLTLSKFSGQAVLI